MIILTFVGIMVAAPRKEGRHLWSWEAHSCTSWTNIQQRCIQEHHLHKTISFQLHIAIEVALAICRPCISPTAVPELFSRVNARNWVMVKFDLLHQ